jgi:hypothetical protein
MIYECLRSAPAVTPLPGEGRQGPVRRVTTLLHRLDRVRTRTSITSHEHYDRETGVSVFTAPSVKPGKFFLYYDPIDTLAPDIQARWKDPFEAEKMVEDAADKAGAKLDSRAHASSIRG